MKILSASAAAAMTFFRCSLLTGEPVIFPTDTIYGIGAPLTSVRANERIYDIKRREQGRPMPVLVSSYEQLWDIAEPVAGSVLVWLRSVWPGPYTVVFKAKNLPLLYTSGGTVAVRMLRDGWLRDAVGCIGPVTATSANMSGIAPLTEPEAIWDAFGGLCRFMLWGVSGDKRSKIVDITGGAVKILRN